MSLPFVAERLPLPPADPLCEVEIKIYIPEPQARELIFGRVPPDVQNALISGLIAMNEEPAAAMERERLRQATEEDQ